MRLAGCAREAELTDLLARGQWPAASSDELRAHVAGCRACRDLVLVRQAFAAERSKAAGEARLEPPGVLWWRAQLRRRNAAIERIGRPLLGAQIFALAVCLAAALAYVFSQARRGFDWLDWLAELPRSLHLGAAFHLQALMPESLGKSPWEIWLAVSIAVTVALMGGFIVYMASDKHSGQ